METFVPHPSIKLIDSDNVTYTLSDLDSYEFKAEKMV